MRLVQKYVPRLKRRRARRTCRLRETLRQHIHVHNEGAIWSIDAAQMGRDDSVPVRAEVVRDVGARRTAGVGVAKSMSSPRVIVVLKAAHPG
ncbi:MAG: hypothetical protein U1E76_07790 [Planctomycetota bacterium]